MDQLDKYKLEMTVGDLRAVLDELNPLIKLVELSEKFKSEAEFWESQAKRKDLLVRTIVIERDAAIQRLAEYKKTNPVGIGG